MSVSSILAFVLAGVAAKAKSVQVARPSKDRRIAELEARVAELEADIATANELARRDQELIDMWRERALANVPAVVAGPLRPAGPDFRPAQMLQAQAQAQMLQAQLAQYQQYQGLAQQQYNAQQAMNAQNFYVDRGHSHGLLGDAIPMGLLGAQNLNAELFCNCVPSRSQVWAASDPE